VTLLGGEAQINGRVTKAPDFVLVRGGELPGNYEGFTRVVPEYRPWRRGLQDLEGLQFFAAGAASGRGESS